MVTFGAPTLHQLGVLICRMFRREYAIFGENGYYGCRLANGHYRTPGTAPGWYYYANSDEYPLRRRKQLYLADLNDPDSWRLCDTETLADYPISGGCLCSSLSRYDLPSDNLVYEIERAINQFVPTYYWSQSETAWETVPKLVSNPGWAIILPDGADSNLLDAGDGNRVRSWLGTRLSGWAHFLDSAYVTNYSLTGMLTGLEHFAFSITEDPETHQWHCYSPLSSAKWRVYRADDISSDTYCLAEQGAGQTYTTTTANDGSNLYRIAIDVEDSGLFP